MRELREETGYDVELGRILGVDSWVVDADNRLDGSGRPLKSVRMIFEGHVVGGTLTADVDGTTDEARWIPLAEVPTLRRVGLVDSVLSWLDLSP